MLVEKRMTVYPEISAHDIPNEWSFECWPNNISLLNPVANLTNASVRLIYSGRRRARPIFSYLIIGHENAKDSEDDGRPTQTLHCRQDIFNIVRIAGDSGKRGISQRRRKIGVLYSGHGRL